MNLVIRIKCRIAAGQFAGFDQSFLVVWPIGLNLQLIFEHPAQLEVIGLTTRIYFIALRRPEIQLGAERWIRCIYNRWYFW